MFEVECGPCNDGICDWMPCSFPGLCNHCSISQEETKMTVKKATAEAKGTSTEFVYKEVTFTLPPAKKWPLEAIEAQESNKMLTFLKAVLGDPQYAEFKKAVPDLEELDLFLTEMFKAVDTDPGK